MALFPASARDDWRVRALCRDADPEIFFPVGDPGDPFDPRNAEPLAYCAACPVRAQCLAFALDELPYGVAGGMTAEARHEYRRYRVRRAAAATAPAVPMPEPMPEPTPEPAEPVAPAARVLSAPTGPPAPDSRRAVRGRGVALLRAGEPWGKIAEQCDVSYRTVERWAAGHGVPRPAAPTRPRNPFSAREVRAMGASGARRPTNLARRVSA